MNYYFLTIFSLISFNAGQFIVFNQQSVKSSNCYINMGNYKTDIKDMREIFNVPNDKKLSYKQIKIYLAYLHNRCMNNE